MGNRRMRVAIARAAKVLGMKWRPRRDDESIPDDLITVDEAAKRYGLSAQTVRNRFDSYEWLGRRANGGMGPRLFRASTIDAILADAEADGDVDEKRPPEGGRFPLELHVRVSSLDPQTPWRGRRLGWSVSMSRRRRRLGRLRRRLR